MLLLWLEETAGAEPVVKDINPVIDREIVLFHAESVAAFGVDVKFGRLACSLPGAIKTRTEASGHERVIVGAEDEQWGRVGGNCDRGKRRTVDGHGEVGACFR